MNRRVFRSRMMRLLVGGTLCLVAWLLLLRVNGNAVFVYLDRFVAHDDARYLLVSAGNLVGLNTLRAMFLYLGWFYLGESVALSRRGRTWSWLVPIVAIPICYFIVSRTPESFSIDLGAPALFGILTVLVMHISTREIRGWLARTLVISLLVFSFQWLDIAPTLTAWGFGRGELSLAIKSLALLEDWGWVLDWIGIGLFATAFSGGIAAAALLIGANKRDIQFRKIRERDMEIASLREEALRVRGYREIQQLVHDLRRPLTTVTGLADVMAETLPDGPHRDHSRRMVRTAADMNQMIEELLQEDARQSVTVAALLEYVQSQISAFDWRHLVAVEVGERVAARRLRVNLVRLSRALVNVLDNARLAIVSTGHTSHKKIVLRAQAEDDRIAFTVVDDGPGFTRGTEAVSAGYSDWGSTGIGLAFADEVVRNHQGALSIANRPGGGASVTLEIPIGEEEDDVA